MGRYIQLRMYQSRDGSVWYSWFMWRRPGLDGWRFLCVNGRGSVAEVAVDCDIRKAGGEDDVVVVPEVEAEREALAFSSINCIYPGATLLVLL
ncbi:unnamed protein product [Cochlearia groenlandica]